jgi:predicted nucleic acid-binding protein
VIVLDTNVLSALMRRETDPAVVAWLDAQPSESIWTTSITVFEVRFGLEIMATGRRRRLLEDAFKTMLEEDFEGRVIPFDDAAAHAAARIAAERGVTIEIRDVQIAGIAAARKATIATRNVRHFQGLGPPLVDPWSA